MLLTANLMFGMFPNISMKKELENFSKVREKTYWSIVFNFRFVALFGYRSTQDFFHDAGNLDVTRDRLKIVVKGPENTSEPFFNFQNYLHSEALCSKPHLGQDFLFL